MNTLRSALHRWRGLVPLLISGWFGVNAHAADWYLQADSTNWNTLGAWFSAPSGGGANPAAFSAADRYHLNGYTMRTPSSAAAATFPGGTLVINGKSGVPGGEYTYGSVLLKLSGTSPTTIANLVAEGGPARNISNAAGATCRLVVNNLGLAKDETTSISTGESTRALDLTLGAVKGAGNLNFIGGGATTLSIGSAGDLYGTLYVTANTKVTINSSFTSSGSLIIESGSQVTLNGNITVTGLRVGGLMNNTDKLFGLATTGTGYAPNATYSFATLNAAFPAIFPAGTGSITVVPPKIKVDAAQVVNTVGAAQLGANLDDNPFWHTIAPDYIGDMKKAKIGMLRVGGYPKNGAATESVERLDMRVIQTLNVGAIPQFIQLIDTAAHRPAFDAALLDLDGNKGTGGTVATNMAYLVKRYMEPPYNLATQIWEVGNEPDINVNYRVSSPAEYVAFYQSIHDQLVASGIRQNVILCGPTVAFEYGFAANENRTDPIVRALITAASAPRGGYNQLDVLTRHVYPELYGWETDAPDPAVTPYNYLNHPTEMVTFTQAHGFKSYRGEGALQSLMNAAGIPATTGTGITEFQVTSAYRHTITQGLWFLVYQHFGLYNPRNTLGAGFKFTDPGHPLSYYSSNKLPSFPYWATYIHGVLTGDDVLAQNSSDSHLLVSATKDDSYVYLQVLNRHTENIQASVSIANAPVTGTATLYELTPTVRPDVAQTTALGTSFTYDFPAMTARVFRYLRTDAPTPPVPSAPPTTVVLDTTFDTAPTGMQVFTDGAFTPLIVGGDLKLTHNFANTATAVVFNGQPLAVASKRVQARFCFRTGKNGTGIVFGAYSASPNSVGASGLGAGYHGQPHRLWGVKIQNGSPHHIAIVPTTSDASVDGWATRALDAYNAMDVFVVADYDGDEGTVRARFYQGTDETGLLCADITNTLGNVGELPAGTVFGFTGGTQSWSEQTFIHNLTILTGAAGPGPNLIANPGFEADPATQTPTGWTEWKTPAASFTESTGGAHGGSFHGTHESTAASYEVSTIQNKTALAPGLYTLRAWVKSGGGQTAQLYIKGHNVSSPSTKVAVTIPAASTWTQLTIPNINVTNSTAEVGLWSKTSSAGKWIHFDDVEFFKQ